MLNKLTKITAVSVLALASQLSFGHAGYVVSGNGSPVTSGNGHCVSHTSLIDAEGCFPEAEPEVVVEPEAKPVVVAKPEVKPVVAPKPKPKPAPVLVQKSFSLSGDVLFATNKSDLSITGKAEINSVIQEIRDLQALTIGKIAILGHADSRGRADYNQVLSEARAQAVADYMIEKGIDPSILQPAGAGETQPKVSNDTAEGRAQNRRVDISLSGTRVQ